MPQVSAAVLRSTPSSTSASASIRRAAALSFSPLAALRSSEAVRSSRVIDTAAPIDAAPLKGQHRVRVSLIWESLNESQFRAVGIRHRQTKGAATDMFYLTPPRHISTLPIASLWLCAGHVVCC